MKVRVKLGTWCEIHPHMVEDCLKIGFVGCFNIDCDNIECKKCRFNGGLSKDIDTLEVKYED